MLFNVYYKEEFFPLLKEVKYIVNENTGEILTLTEFVENIPTYDETNHIRSLKVFYPFLEKELLRQNYDCKHTSTELFTRYTSALKPKTYVADIHIKASNGAAVGKTINKMRIGSTGGTKYFICFDAFTSYQKINEPTAQEEIEFANYLSSIQCHETTPASSMKEDYDLNRKNNLFKISGDIMTNIEFVNAMRSTIKNPAIIEAYDLGHFDEAWSYDVNSMYTAMLNSLEYLPACGNAMKVSQAQIIPLDWFGWHEVGHLKWEVRFGGETLEPGDWLVPCESKKNPYKKMAIKMFEDKQKYKQQGGYAYRFYKQKANSFIGSFAQKNRLSMHFNYWDDESGRVEEPKIYYPRYDIFSIITTLARRYITLLMDKARECGCNVLQVNTDGFITDKPLPESMLGTSLGALRLDKHLTNLFIFSPNRYVADGVQSISGLPSGMYEPGQTTYHYDKISLSFQDDAPFRIITVEIDLMEEINCYNKTLEELYA